jgi:hypothetical protein
MSNKDDDKDDKYSKGLMGGVNIYSGIDQIISNKKHNPSSYINAGKKIFSGGNSMLGMIPNYNTRYGSAIKGAVNIGQGIEEIATDEDEDPEDYLSSGHKITNGIQDVAKLTKAGRNFMKSTLGKIGGTGLSFLGMGLDVVDLVKNGKNQNFVQNIDQGLDIAFKAVELIPGVGQIINGIAVPFHMFMNGMSDVWEIQKENAQIKQENERVSREVDLINQRHETQKEIQKVLDDYREEGENNLRQAYERKRSAKNVRENKLDVKHNVINKGMAEGGKQDYGFFTDRGLALPSTYYERVQGNIKK